MPGVQRERVYELENHLIGNRNENIYAGRLVVTA